MRISAFSFNKMSNHETNDSSNVTKGYSFGAKTPIPKFTPFQTKQATILEDENGCATFQNSKPSTVRGKT